MKKVGCGHAAHAGKPCTGKGQASEEAREKKKGVPEGFTLRGKKEPPDDKKVGKGQALPGGTPMKAKVGKGQFPQQPPMMGGASPGAPPSMGRPPMGGPPPPPMGMPGMGMPPAGGQPELPGMPPMMPKSPVKTPRKSKAKPTAGTIGPKKKAAVTQRYSPRGTRR